MSARPTDTEILGAIRDRRGMVMPTYYIKNVLRGSFPGVQTPWVLRRLKTLEKAGYVQRAPTTCATMICWELADRAPAQGAAALRAASTDSDKGSAA